MGAAVPVTVAVCVREGGFGHGGEGHVGLHTGLVSISLLEKGLGGRGAYVIKIKRIQQIRHMISSPLHQLRRLDTRHTLGRQPLFNKQNLRRMVCVFREDAPPAGPGGDDVEGYAETGAREDTAEDA